MADRSGYRHSAEQARQFVHHLPPARTEREWLMAGLAGHLHGSPLREQAAEQGAGAVDLAYFINLK